MQHYRERALACADGMDRRVRTTVSAHHRAEDSCAALARLLRRTRSGAVSALDVASIVEVQAGAVRARLPR
jgi:hypothetical protein